VKPSDDRGIFIVVGMHRSGTSLLAGLLHHAGVSMGSPRTFRPRPNPENPLGFFENVRFRRLNDRVLASSGYSVKSWDPKVPTITASPWQRAAMRRLLRRQARRHGRWGWKDPRQPLTCSVWARELDQLGFGPRTRLLLVFRDPRAVANSLISRGNVPTVAEGLVLWRVYNERALDVAEGWNLAVRAVSFETMVRDPVETLSRFGRSIDVRFDEQAVTRFVTPSLDRSTGAREEHDLEEPYVSECDRLWTRLRQLEEATLRPDGE
jgi:hypothetical protein